MKDACIFTELLYTCTLAAKHMQVAELQTYCIKNPLKSPLLWGEYEVGRGREGVCSMRAATGVCVGGAILPPNAVYVRLQQAGFRQGSGLQVQ